MTLDESRLLNDIFEASDRWIKSFQMSYLENESFGTRQVHQFSALLNIRCDGLLDQNVHGALKEITRNFVVQARWNGNTDALHLPEEVPIIRKRCHAQLSRHRFCPLFVNIHHSYQRCFFRIGILFSVKFSQVTHAYNRCGDFGLIKHWQHPYPSRSATTEIPKSSASFSSASFSRRIVLPAST